MQSKIVVVALVALVVVANVVSAGHGKDNKKDKKHGGHHKMGGHNKTHDCPLKNCMVSETVLNQTRALWRQSMEECRLEVFGARPSAPTFLSTSPASADKKNKKHKKAMKKQNKEKMTCLGACHLRKSVFGNDIKLENSKTFAAKLNATAEKAFNEEFSACLSKNSVDLTTLTEENNCQSWKAPVKCFHKSLKKACKGKVDEQAKDDVEDDDSVTEDDSEDDVETSVP